jgi:hypothetical protein
VVGVVGGLAVGGKSGEEQAAKAHRQSKKVTRTRKRIIYTLSRRIRQIQKNPV